MSKLREKMDMLCEFLTRLFNSDDVRLDFRYIGRHGYTNSCIRAIESLVQTEGIPEHVVVITCLDAYGGDHALLLSGKDLEDETIVEEGFASGNHGGQAQRGLSWVVSLFEFLEADISEIVVDQNFMRRLKSHRLNDSDYNMLFDRQKRRGGTHRYVLDADWKRPPAFDGKWPLPLGLLDRRLLPTAINVLKDDSRWGVELNAAYGTLENAIRVKARGVNPNLQDGGAGDLFEKVFGKTPILTWDVPVNEVKGRHMMLSGAFKAFRNQRAHGAAVTDARRDMEEILLLNLLFTLEAEAIPVVTSIPLPMNHSSP